MLIGLALLLGVASVPLAGGRLTRLAALHFRGGWIALVAISVQILIISVLPAGLPALHVALHVTSYLLLAVFLVLNRHVTGLAVIALGGALNALAIALNGGVMPASARALESAGLASDGEAFANSVAVAHPHLLFLGDVFAVPASWPASNVFSIGDLLIVGGATVLLHAACGSRIRLVPPRLRRRSV